MRAAGILVLALVACSSPDGETPTVDSTWVAVIAEVQLADARASLDSLEAETSDSLRLAALASHGWDAGDLEDALDALSQDPDLAKATYDAVDLKLGLERQGVSPKGTGQDSIPTSMLGATTTSP